MEMEEERKVEEFEGFRLLSFIVNRNDRKHNIFPEF